MQNLQFWCRQTTSATHWDCFENFEFNYNEMVCLYIHILSKCGSFLNLKKFREQSHKTNKNKETMLEQHLQNLKSKLTLLRDFFFKQHVFKNCTQIDWCKITGAWSNLISNYSKSHYLIINSTHLWPMVCVYLWVPDPWAEAAPYEDPC